MKEKYTCVQKTAVRGAKTVDRRRRKKIVTLLTTKEGDSKMMEGDFIDVVEKLSDQGEKCCEKIQLCILWRVVTSGSGIEKINLCKKVDSDG